MARGWLPWRHAVDGGARRPARRAEGAVERCALGDHARDELCAGARSVRAGRASRSRAHLGLCAGRRLSQDGQVRAQGAGALDRRAGERRRGEGVRRYRAGDGKAARDGRGPRLAGQAYQPGQPQPWQLAVPRRDLYHARARAERRGARPLRIVHRLPDGVPDRCVSGALSARCPSLHLVSDDRACGADSARAARRHRQPCVRLRRLPRGLPVEQVRRCRAPQPGLPAARRAGCALARRSAGTRRCRFPRAVLGLADQAQRARANGTQCGCRGGQ